MTPFVTTPLYSFVICYLLVQVGYFTYNQIAIRIARRRMIKAHGCQPPPSPLEDRSWFSYPFGLKFVKDVKKAVKEHRLLEVSQVRYQELGHTHSAKVGIIINPFDKF